MGECRGAMRERLGAFVALSFPVVISVLATLPIANK